MKKERIGYPLMLEKDLTAETKKIKDYLSKVECCQRCGSGNAGIITDWMRVPNKTFLIGIYQIKCLTCNTKSPFSDNLHLAIDSWNQLWSECNYWEINYYGFNPEKQVQTINKDERVFDKDLKQKVTDILDDLEINPKLQGYHFLREAIILIVQDVQYLQRITKVLYPTIAKNYNSTGSRVERSIRHAIELAYNNGKLGNKNKPTNGDFMASVAEKLRMNNRFDYTKKEMV
ncbi:MAG: hypothetical protein FWC41_00085 [Firmicutes bacterium]|nr:hypothetical protein [Bacillota bacterium]